MGGGRGKRACSCEGGEGVRFWVFCAYVLIELPLSVQFNHPLSVQCCFMQSD